MPITGPTEMLVVTAGGVTVSGATGHHVRSRGATPRSSPPDESPLTVTGSGVAFIATTK